MNERLRPSVQLADPIPRLEVGPPLAGLELAVLPDAYANQPRGAADPEPSALLVALHHPDKGRLDQRPEPKAGCGVKPLRSSGGGQCSRS